MSSPIAGVAPSTLEEVTNMIVWPSLAARADGRMLGRMYENKALSSVLPLNLNLGKLLAFASIPLVLPLYFFTKLPRVPFVVFGFKNSSCVRYRLTNRRIIVELPFAAEEVRSVSLDRFDNIEIEVQPGQRWYLAGDLVFKLGETETFRLSGIQRPEPFRRTCLHAQRSFAGVSKAREAGAAV